MMELAKAQEGKGDLDELCRFPCSFCSALFTSEVKLLLHFHETHFTAPQKQWWKGSKSEIPEPDVPGKDDDIDEFESDLGSDGSDKGNESGGEEGQDPLDFLTDCERKILENPVLPQASSPILPGRNCKQAKPSSSGVCKRQATTLRLLPLLRAKKKVATESSETKVTNNVKEVITEEITIKVITIRKQVYPETIQPSWFECIFCDKSYSKYYEYCAHICGDHTKEQPFFCKLCSHCFPRNSNLTRHMKSHHPESTPYECEICSASFSTEHKLTTHMTAHSNERRLQCEHCKKRFNYNSELLNHMASHTEEKQHECDQCKKRFSVRSDLLAHRKRIHNIYVKKDLVLLRCLECQKTFRGNARLHDHIATHTKDKKFECEQCKARFSRKRDVTRHMKSFHLSLKEPISCQLCEEKFNSRDALLAHKRDAHSKSKLREI